MFYLEYDHGFVVTTMVWSDNYETLVEKPLRKFLEQGHALIFREEDCPHLSDMQIKYLIKMYNPKVLYKRVSSKRFVKVNEELI